MVKISLYKQLERNSVFDAKKVSRIAKTSLNYARLLIHRMKREGVIYQIERNKYTVHEDVLIVASHIIWPSYISGWTTLNFYHLTEQIPTTITIITTKGKRNRELLFANTRIEFIKVKPKYFFGYGKIIYRDFEIFIAEKEKAIIDAILLKNISFSAIAEILKNNKNELNLNKLANYAVKTQEYGTIKRLGFLLEKFGTEIKVLKRFVKGRYILLDYTMPSCGKKNEKWKVIENVKL